MLQLAASFKKAVPLNVNKYKKIKKEIK